MISLLTQVNNDTNKVDLLANITYLYNDLEPGKGINFGKEGLILADELHFKKGIAKLNAGIAQNYFALDNLPEALSYWLKALALYEDLGYNSDIASTNINIGNVYCTQNNFIKGLDYLQSALKYSKELNDKERIAINMDGIAGAYNGLKQYQKALEYYNNALQINNEIGNQSDAAGNIGNIGTVYFSMANYPKALENYVQALKIKEATGDKGSVIIDLGNIGECYFLISTDTIASSSKDRLAVGGKRENLKKSIVYLDSAVQLANKIGFLNAIQEYSGYLARALTASGDYKDAVNSYVAFIKIKDSVFNIENNERITNLETRRELDLKEKQILIDRLEVDKKRKERGFYMGGIGVLLIILVIIFRNYKRISAEKLRSDTLLQEIKLKNKEITDNIQYAKRIQSAILPDVQLIYKAFPRSFVLFQPKDIVSGDFFVFAGKNNRVIIVASDCTGHGVSGAFMSMIGSSLLNQIINEKGLVEPAAILNMLNVNVITALNQNETESSDGMDIAICSFDLSRNLLQFAGANRPLWLVRDHKLEVFKPDKLPIGGLQMARDRTFSNHNVQLQENDTVYIFTDGYADQFGGHSGKKMMTSGFKELLLSLENDDMRSQEKRLRFFFDQWKGNQEQVDDVLVIGIRI